VNQITLPYNPPKWIYEGNDPKRIEFNSGSVINRSPRQIFENLLALKGYVENFVDNFSSPTFVLRVENLSEDEIIDTIDVDKFSSAKWYVDLFFKSSPLGILRWTSSTSTDVVGYYLYLGNSEDVSYNDLRFDLGSTNEVNLDELNFNQTLGDTFLGIAPYDDYGNIGDLTKKSLDLSTRLSGKLSCEIHASHDKYDGNPATEVSYTLSSVKRFGLFRCNIPLFLDIDESQQVRLRLSTSKLVDVSFTRIIVPN
jgi:hypothetical protein